MHYIITIGLSSFLLFLIQPLITKQILPYYGGGSSIWTTNLFFFQTLLLIGYGYANYLQTKVKFKIGKTVHIVFLIISSIVLLFIPNQIYTLQNLFISQILTLVSLIGLPYLVLSATSPLIQSYFNQTKSQLNQNYKLYAVSNTFSLLGLFIYPFILEPYFGLNTQVWIWKILYLVFVALNIILLLKQKQIDQVKDNNVINSLKSINLKQKLSWIIFAFLGSMSLSAIANYLSLDVAGLPFIWVLPLAIYLLSFIVVFGKLINYSSQFFSWSTLIMSLVLVCVTNSSLKNSIFILIPALLSLLFLLTLFFHGEMERFKPEVNDLTNYYFLTSLGSVLGSAFVSLIIPLIFSDYWDLSLLAALSCLAVLALNFKLLNNNRLKISAFISTILVISLGIFFSINTFLKYDYISRNYYGVLKIKTVLNQEKNLSYKMLQNNNINHGIQYLDPIYSQIPTSYYNEYSGLGLVNKIIDSKQSTKKLGMIGLGAGTVASYCRQGDKCGIYEIDNQVINIAENQFTYLSDARKRGVDVQTYLGDGRNVIESQTNDYDLLGVDAFSGDSIPSHLFTDNAIKIFSKQIKSDGYLAFHTSNRYFNLAPILARLALENNFQTFQVNYKGKGEDESSNSWVILTKKLIPIEDYPDYQIKELKSDINQTFWTDDYNSLMHIWIGINKKLF